MKEMTIKKLLERVEKKQFLLPNIQRGFVWEPKKIENLFDSLMRGFPISSFLFWEVKDDDEDSFTFYDFEKDYNFYDDKKLEPEKFGNHTPHWAVLDGQQRITSFYIGLKGSYIPKSRKRGEKSPKKLYLNLLKINADDNNGEADAGLDNVYEFKFLTDAEVKKDNENADDKEHFWFKVGDIISDSFKNIEVIDDYEEDRKNKNITEKTPACTILRRLWRVIREKEFIEYHSTEDKTLDDVLNIFVRINNGGKPVAISDLLVSLATARLNNRDVVNDLKNIVKEVNDIGGKNYFNISRDFVLRTFLVLCDGKTEDKNEDKKNIKFRVANFKNNARMQEIDKNWDKMFEAIKSAVNLVYEFGFTQKHFASNNALIPLVQYIYLKDNKPENYSADKVKMIHWFINATLGGVFSRSTDEQLNKFRNLLNKSHESFPLRAMLEVADNTTDEKLAENLLNLIMNANYGYIKSAWMALGILYNNPAYISPNAELDIDHMFPQAKNSEYEGIDTLPNLQILTSQENRKKRSTYFSDWVKNKPAEYKEENFVPDEVEDFEKFTAAREILIREKIFENLKICGVI